jgi:hypothetical protein
MLSGQPHDDTEHCGCGGESKDLGNHTVILGAANMAAFHAGCYGLQVQCDHGVFPWSIERWTTQAVVAMFAAGSKGEAPPNPAGGAAHAHVDGMNWKRPDAPDDGL